MAGDARVQDLAGARTVRATRRVDLAQRELLGPADAVLFDQDAAQAIADCDSLALAWKTGATGAPVLEITANGANALVALRSGEEQAA